MAVYYHFTRGYYKTLKNPRLDQLIETVTTIKDPAERKRLATEAVKLAYDSYTGLRIMAYNTIVAYGSNIGKISPYRTPYGISGLQLETITHGN